MNQHVAIKAAASASSAFNSDDFHRMMDLGAFEDIRVELVRGKLEKMAPADTGHGFANASVLLRLASALTDAEKRVAIDVAVKIDEETVRAPDIIMLHQPWAGERRMHASALELAIEISDTTLGKDLGEKSVDYARGGVPFYWVVDVNTRSVHVFSSPEGEGYERRELCSFDDEIAVPGTDRKIRLG